MTETREGQGHDDGRKAPDRASRQEERGHGSKVTVIAAILGNILVGVVKFIAAVISGSVAMASEGIHSIVDCGNGLLILLGMRKADREPDFLHPFGYGKELYFWTLAVSLLIFALGGCVSIFEGAHAIQQVMADPSAPMGNPTLNYIVILAAMIIEGASLSVGLKQFNKARGDVKPFRFIRDAKDPSLFTVVFEDTAAELGLVFALAGIFFGHLLHNPYLDGAASICIGALLCTVAVILLRETKGLLVGEGMAYSDLEQVRAIVEANPAVESCGRILTMYMGPHHLIVTIDAGFKRDISAEEVLNAIDEVESAIRSTFPEADCIFMEAEGLAQVRRQHAEFDTRESLAD